ncbi:MAG: CHY zinc finger-domain-containing protein [Benjaminiella poitrasii]|nr:MAG: CHY zinc finger-domain-containing protein [Benjaminiella poitrasii]
MCKHILNAQVAIRAPCCKKWFDCAECHAAVSDHPLRKTNEMVFACKKCKKAFRKDMIDYEEEDEYCPHCDNHYVIDAVIPEPKLNIETEDIRVDSRVVKDERIRPKQDQLKSIFQIDGSDMLG